MEEISGFLEGIVYINPENGFTVAKLKEPHKKDFTTIVGAMSEIQPGETLVCKGGWTFHPSHGRQFEVTEYTTKYPADLLGIQKYLESGLIKGIGPVYAKKIVDKFGLDTLTIIESVPQRLKEVTGIGDKRCSIIKACWDEQKSIRDVMIFLRSHEVSPSHAQKIFKLYGNNSIKKVSENPYKLAKEVHGIGFKSADSIAKKLGFADNSPLRIQSGIEHVLWELSGDGHTCYLKSALLEVANSILNVDVNSIKSQLEELIAKNEIIQSKLLLEGEEADFVWLKPLYFFEEGIAKELHRLKNHTCSLRDVDTQKAIEWVQEKLNIKLASLQKEGILKGISEKLHILTGGPGTGKSTITNAILTITEKLTRKILLAAPTGRAAKRLTEITHKKAFTIHALLEFDFTNGGFKKNRERPLNCDLIIIDESSMIDTQLMYYLLRAIPDSARVIFVGDIDQLPSVGPGYVLKDIIKSQAVSVTKLTEIFRQAKGSKIILSAHNINAGEFPYLTNSPFSDFCFIEMKEPEEIQKKILSLIKDEIPKSKKFDPFDEIQVLSPMKRGVIGTENLNVVLQSALNPSDTPFFRGGRKFHVGDKVMQIKNNYNKKVYNGDLGKIVQINTSDQELIVGFDDKLVTYDFSELDELILAYAVSVHKYQGSEYPCIIIPVHMSHFKLLHRNLLYTAVTRGKKYVVLIGTKQAIAMCIKNEEVLKRYTGLERAIRQKFQ